MLSEQRVAIRRPALGGRAVLRAQLLELAHQALHARVAVGLGQRQHRLALVRVALAVVTHRSLAGWRVGKYIVESRKINEELPDNSKNN